MCRLKPSEVEWIGEIPGAFGTEAVEVWHDINMGQSPDNQKDNHSGHGMPFLQVER